ncbi:MAG: AAA family ATPase, partial [Alphaproteobacteria bacterium]|nr:AAA family ATPase [Alphaproteobacteria bacterium]
MHLDHIYIKGFRNFKEITVNFNKHSLIIGANDVGKTNIIYAMRLLLDKGFSYYDFELKDSDFFAYDDTNEVVIRI